MSGLSKTNLVTKFSTFVTFSLAIWQNDWELVRKATLRHKGFWRRLCQSWAKKDDCAQNNWTRGGLSPISTFNSRAQTSLSLWTWTLELDLSPKVSLKKCNLHLYPPLNFSKIKSSGLYSMNLKFSLGLWAQAQAQACFATELYCKIIHLALFIFTPNRAWASLSYQWSFTNLAPF